MPQTVSKYKNYVIAPKKKVYLANIADYLLTFILTFLLFAVAGSPILSALPITKDSYTVLANHVDTLYTIIDDTHLQSYEKVSGTLSNLNLDGKEYAKTLSKTSYYVLGLKYPVKQSDGSYAEVDVPLSETFLADLENHPLDRPGYYFHNFKATCSCIDNYVYDGVDYREKKDEYLYQKAFGYTVDWFTKTNADLPLWQQLNEERAKALTAYLVYDDSATVAPYETYKEVLRGYKEAINRFIAEVETTYQPMLQEMTLFDAALKTYDGVIIADYHLCYLVAILVLELVLPLILKEGRTIGARAMKMGYSTDEEATPAWWHFLIKGAMRFAIHYSGLFFCMMLTSSYSLAFVSFGWFNFFIPIVASSLLGAASLVMVGVRKNSQGIAETAARLLPKDATQLERGEAKEDVKEGGHGTL